MSWCTALQPVCRHHAAGMASAGCSCQLWPGTVPLLLAANHGLQPVCRHMWQARPLLDVAASCSPLLLTLVCDAPASDSR